MTALTMFVAALAAQRYPTEYPGGPVDPWGKTQSLTILRARHEFDALTDGARKSRDIEISVLTVGEREATIGWNLGTSLAHTTMTRDVPGSFRIEKERVLELKPATEEELTVVGMKFTCKLTHARIKVGGVRKPGDAFDVEGPSKEVDTLKVWTTDRIPGGVAKLEWDRHPFNVERGEPTRHRGEVTKLDEKLAFGKSTLTCCIFTIQTVSPRRSEETVRAWHCDDVPGKVARIEIERKRKDRTLKDEWVITEIDKTLLFQKDKK